jgi:hypothetical protein
LLQLCLLKASFVAEHGVLVRIRSYPELRRIETFEDRFKYLALKGVVGDSTFGFDRYINQQFYTSREWRQIRHHVIARDNGCDLGIEGYEIHSKLIIHHMNPMTADDIVQGDEDILNPDFLITTTLQTHNAIHYGDERLLPRPFVERRPGDTKLW